MVDTSTDERVLLALAGDDPPGDGYRSVVEIGEMLEMSAETMADRIALLSTLSGLEEDGLVETSTGERTRYALTDEGRDRARAVDERVADHRIEVRNGDAETVRLAEVDRFLDPPATARALARLTDDDVLYLDEGVDREFVDREHERERLRSVYDAVADGGRRSVLVTGEAGIGKTTLVDRFLNSVRGEATVLEGVCRRDTTEPYQPVRAALDPHVSTSPFDRPELAVEDPEGLHAQRAALFADVADAVRDLAREGPVVLFLDDLNVAAGPTTELVGALVEHLADAPVVLVGTSRSAELSEQFEARLGVGGDGPGERIDLEPFDREDTRRLVEWLVGTRRVPEGFVDLVDDRTGGNPLFVTESVTQLLDSGEIDPARDLYPDSLDRLSIPEGAEAAIDRRLEALDDAGRAVVSTAALLGESLDYEVLAAAVDLPDEAVREYVDLLSDAQVLEPVEGDADLRFVSGLLRETAVDRIPDERREDYHRRIAAGLTDVVGDDPERAGAVAYHYERAGDRERALDAWVEAGEHAESVYAHELAVSAYEHALDLARERDDDEQVAAVLESMGEVQWLLGDLDEAERAFEYVYDEAPAPETRQRGADALARILAKNEPGRAIEITEEAIGLVDRDPGTPADCRLLIQRGRAHEVRGEFDSAEGYFEEALDLAEALEDPELRGMALHARAQMERLRDQSTVGEEAVEMMEEAVEIRREHGDRGAVAESLRDLGSLYLWQHRVEDHVETQRRAREMYQEIGDRVGAMSTLYNLTLTEGLRSLSGVGDVEEMIDQADEVLAEARALGHRRGIFSGLLVKAVLLWQGRYDVDAALEHMREALSLAEQADNARIETASLHFMGTVSLQTGRDPDEALEYGERMLELAREAEMPVQQVWANTLVGDVHLSTGDAGTALDHLQEAVEVAMGSDDAILEIDARTSLANALLANDDTGGARDQAERAAELVDGVDEAETLARPIRALRRPLVRTGGVLAKCDRAEGDLQSAIEGFEAALEDARDDRDRFYEAELHHELGVTHRRAGNHGPAREHFEEGLAIAEEIGAGSTAAGCRSELDGLAAD